MMRALIFGATGFLGRHLMNEMRWHPHCKAVLGVSRSAGTVITKHNDLASCNIDDPEDVKRIIRSFKPDTIFHLAANPIVKMDEINPFDIQRTNVLGTHHILHYAPANCRFVYASSATVYGREVEKATPVHENKRLKPNSVYGATKASSEALVDAYTDLGRVSGICLRLVANVGKYSTHGLLHDVMRKALSTNPKLELLGDRPGSVKPFVFVNDTIQAFVRAAKSRWGGAFNIATNTTLSVENVAQIVLKQLNIEKEIVFLGQSSNWQGDNNRVNINSENAYHQLGWRPTCPTSEKAIVAAVRQIIKREQLCRQS